MDSVAVDLFAIPSVIFEGEEYDTVIVCVCRASGYILAEPARNKGLTAAKEGKFMCKNWDLFGIPSFISSDGGPHFGYSCGRSYVLILG